MLVSIVAVVAMALFATVLASGGVVTSRKLSASGVISTTNLGLYSDYACTQTLTSISWGDISPGSTVSKTIYVKNTGSQPITLSMSGDNWYPDSAAAVMTLGWDKEGVVLSAGQVAISNLWLSVSSGVSGIGTFNVDIVISGTA